jgi:hypothetical protein
MTRIRNQSLTFISSLTFIVPLLLVGFAAHAQDGAKEKLAQAQKQNAAQLTPGQGPAAPDAEGSPADEGWPRRWVKDGATLLTHQPQVDDWQDLRRWNGAWLLVLRPRAVNPSSAP